MRNRTQNPSHSGKAEETSNKEETQSQISESSIVQNSPTPTTALTHRRRCRPGQ